MAEDIIIPLDDPKFIPGFVQEMVRQVDEEFVPQAVEEVERHDDIVPTGKIHRPRIRSKSLAIFGYADGVI